MSPQNRPVARRSNTPARPMAVRMEPPKKSTGCGSIVIGVLMLALVLAVLLMMIGILPNPLEPKPTALIPQTETTKPLPTSQDSTPFQQNTPTSTRTPQPSATRTPEPTLTPTQTLTPTEKPMPFVIKGMPKGYPNSMLFPQYTCEQYLFIGGEVVDLREAPVSGLTVKLAGTYGGSTVDQTSVSGDVTVYGQSGFGFVLENLRVREGRITIQLFDGSGQALSAQTFLSITGNCDTNLMIVNYKQVREIQP